MFDNPLVRGTDSLLPPEITADYYITGRKVGACAASTQPAVGVDLCEVLQQKYQVDYVTKEDDRITEVIY